MARGKNSTALFEVIHTAKKPPKASPSGGGIPAPKWWAKGHKPDDSQTADGSPVETDDGPPPAAAETSGGTRRSWLAAARGTIGPPAAEPAFNDPSDADLSDGPVGDSKVVITRIYPIDAPEPPMVDDHGNDHSANDDVDEPVAEVVPEPEGKLSWAARRAKVAAERTPSDDPSFDPTANVAPADLRGERSARWASTPVDDDRPARRPRQSAGPTPSALKPDVDPAVSLDRNAGELRLRLSYGAAIAAGVILLVVMVIAYLAGQRSGTNESASEAGVPNGAKVAHVPPVASPVDAAATPSRMLAAVSPTNPVAPAADVGTPSPAAVAPAVVALPATREVGMMYAVVQSYPDRETANKAAAYLNTSGVSCTVVAGPTGFALRDWSSVVCLRPFLRTTRTADVQGYLTSIAQLGPKFSNKVYNQFQPRMYIWRADSDAPRP